MATFMEGLVVGLLGAVVVAVIMLLVGTLYAFPVMWIWNYLMPELFALPVITFWQAFWGTFLCGLLFKSSSVQSSK
jgi:hypothetical protein